MKLKFITLNIWDGGRLLANIIDFLNQENPDIVCLQEVNNLTDPQVELRYRSFQYFKKKTGTNQQTLSDAFKQTGKCRCNRIR